MIRRKGQTEFVPAEPPIVLYDGDVLQYDDAYPEFTGLRSILVPKPGEPTYVWRWLPHAATCPAMLSCPEAGMWEEIPGA